MSKVSEGIEAAKKQMHEAHLREMEMRRKGFTKARGDNPTSKSYHKGGGN